MTLRETILKSIETLSSQGKKEFTPQEVFEIAKDLNPNAKRTSLLGSMTSLLVDIPDSPYPRDQRFLEKVRYGVYKIHQSPTSTTTAPPSPHNRRTGF